MHVMKFTFLLLLSFSFTLAYSRQGALLSGNIQGNQKDNIILQVRPPFSTHSGNGMESFTVPVDKQGNFSFRCRYKNTPVFLYESNEDGPYMLLYLRGSGLSVQWKEGAMRQSFNIVQDTGNLNRVSIHFQ